MKLVTIRVESNLKRLIEKLAEVKGLRISDVARELIEIGIRTQERQETKLIGSMWVEVPFESISLGGDQERLNLYVDEEQLSLAQKIFGATEQAVLRKALRIGVFYIMPPVNEQTALPFTLITEKRSESINPEHLDKVDITHKRVQSYKDELLKIQMVESYIITDEIKNMLVNSIFPNLNIWDYNTIPILVSGAFGSGKSYLISFIAAISEDAGLLRYVNRPEIIVCADNFAGHYVPVFVSDHGNMSLRDRVRSKIIKLCDDVDVKYNSEVDSVSESLSNLMDKFEESYPSKGLLVIMEMDGIDEKESEDLHFIRELIEVSHTSRLKLIVELGSIMTTEGSQEFFSEHFTKIHLEIKDIEGVLLRARARANEVELIEKWKEHLDLLKDNGPLAVYVMEGKGKAVINYIPEVDIFADYNIHKKNS
jgi:hypothetical protein